MPRKTKTPAERAARAKWGERFKAAYEAADLTRAELSRKLVVGYNTVWRYEQGQNAPSAEVAAKIADAIGADAFIALYDGHAVPGDDANYAKLLVLQRQKTNAYATASDWTSVDAEVARRSARDGEVFFGETVATPKRIALRAQGTPSGAATYGTYVELSRAILSLPMVRLAHEIRDCDEQLKLERDDHRAAVLAEAAAWAGEALVAWVTAALQSVDASAEITPAELALFRGPYGLNEILQRRNARLHVLAGSRQRSSAEKHGPDTARK